MEEDETDGGLVIMCEDLPEITTQASNVLDAMDIIGDAFCEAIANRVAIGMDIPTPVCI